MRLRDHLAFPLVAAILGCGGDRTTAPSDDAARAASDLERAAAELGLGADPSASLTYQSIAAAVRGGAPLQQVQIALDGKTESWYAFGHEIRFDPASASTPVDLPIAGGLRALLAWRATAGGSVQVIHLSASADDGPIGQFAPMDLGDGSLVFPSTLLFSEGRNLFWEATSGHQWSSITPGTTPCPGARRPGGAAPPPRCVLATFKFRIADVEAEPFSFPFGPLGSRPSAATGKRRLSMAEQTIDGMQMTIDLRVIGLPPFGVRTVP